MAIFWGGDVKIEIGENWCDRYDLYYGTGEQARCPPQGAFHGDVEHQFFTHECFSCVKR